MMRKGELRNGNWNWNLEVIAPLQESYFSKTVRAKLCLKGPCSTVELEEWECPGRAIQGQRRDSCKTTLRN